MIKVNSKSNNENMTVRQAGKKGGERVSELIDKGKQVEKS